MGMLSLTILLLEIYGSFLFYILIIFKFLYRCHFCSCLHIYILYAKYIIFVYIYYIYRNQDTLL